MTEDRHYRTLGEVAREIRIGAVSPEELASEALDRITALNPCLNAFVALTPDRAHCQARAATREIAGGRYRGALHGVPIAVKDVCLTRASPTNNGLPAAHSHSQRQNAAVVERLEAAGAVMLGKLNMTECASLFHHPEVPEPRSPWHGDLWPGASSSGCGVATAAGLCFASLGSDTLGSIRVPAACNNVAGLKPTWGRVSRFGVAENVPSFDTVGPIARSVADLAAVLGAIAGADTRDPSTLADHVPDYEAGIEQHGSLDGFVVGVDWRFSGLGLDEAGLAVLQRACGVLEDLGAAIVEVEFPAASELAVEQVGVLAATALAAVHGEAFDRHPARYSPVFAEAIEFGRKLPTRVVADAAAACDALARDLAGALDAVDAWVTPVLPGEAETWSQFSALAGRDPGGLLRYTAPASIAGTPGLALPCGRTPTGGFASMQLIGARFSEERLLRIGHLYQTATTWHKEHPALDGERSERTPVVGGMA